VADGNPANPQNPLLAATFCVPPTGSIFVNARDGLPGPARALIDASVEPAY
jgi:hypothetical protein